MPTDYLLDNLNALLKSFTILSNNNIRCCDLHRNNVVVNSNGIYIIDVDDYFYEEDTPRNIILSENYEELIKLIEDLVAFSISQYFSKPSITKGRYMLENRKLFSVDNYTSVNDVSRKLVKYKYPIDYFKERVR